MLADLRAEAAEEDPAVIVTVSDSEGNVVRRLTTSGDAGIHRVVWDLRYPSAIPTSLKPFTPNPFSPAPIGPMATPGRYTVSLAKRVDGKLTPLAASQTFDASGVGSIPAADRASLLAFERKTARLQRAVRGADEVVDETRDRLAHIKQSLLDTPGKDDAALADQARALEARLRDIDVALRGDSVAGERQLPTAPSITDRVEGIVATQWTVSTAPTHTSLDAYAIASDEFEVQLAALKTLVEKDLRGLEEKMEKQGAPFTPGRIPEWHKE
jgi:hypothetical protein